MIQTMTTESTEVKSLETLSGIIATRNANAKMTIEEEITRLNKLHANTAQMVAKLESKLPSIVKSLESMGLGIYSMAYWKTGDHKAWTSEDQLRVSITAVPASNKFKFITFDGYDKSGRGRNYKRLEAKRKKIEDTIKSDTCSGDVDVNPFSLEIKNENDTKRILIEMYISQ